MTAWRVTPAADVVAHATAEMVLAPGADVVSPGNYGEFDAQPVRELDGFVNTLFTAVAALGSERLTPRGEPRQRAAVGALRQR
jgi:hypothetical protein